MTNADFPLPEIDAIDRSTVESWLRRVRGQASYLREQIEVLQNRIARLLEQEGLLMELLATVDGEEETPSRGRSVSSVS